ncbi:hypothetical protein [Sphingobacterium sp.]|uniref:hypothetical protein n=1 Tax=Sphingobacterium sp. TaxID=341027 RepID=UPI00289FFDCD|nr:hypothetical protein [Sphingobacterium sp.]
MSQRKEFRKLLPHGYGKVIAERAGVGVNSVSLYFSGKINSHRIETVVLEVLAEIQNIKKEKMEVIYGQGHNRG